MRKTQRVASQGMSHIVIIGAGTFGLSTCLELLRKGEKNVSLVDPYPIPSPLSAGNDVNKIVQTTVADGFYSDLAIESLARWRSDPVYKEAFHETGIIYGGVSAEAIEEIEERKELLKDRGHPFQVLETAEQFAGLIKPIDNDFHDADGIRFKNWKGYYQKDTCGWAFARLALERAFAECVRLGVHFIQGEAKSLEFENDLCIGVNVDDKLVKADQVVICAGAKSVDLLDFENQLLAKCWTVGHIRLDDSQAEKLKGLPVVLNIDEGFLFEPDSNNEIKFCNEFPGYINLNAKNISIPVYKDLIPLEAESQMRHFLKQVYPEISELKFQVSKICWCTDTTDRHFLFGHHPKYKNLVLGTGDSGKGFKYMPIVGEYLSEMIINGDDSIDSAKREAWKWRPEQSSKRDLYHLQSRLGGTNKVIDLKNIKNWTNGAADQSISVETLHL